MVARYVDASLTGGTTAAYDPTADEGSRHAGGSAAGYQTLAAAISAATTVDDTIYIRGGTYGPSASQVTYNKVVPCLKYRNPTTGVQEDHLLTFDAGIHGINLSASNINGLEFHISGAGGANYRGLFIDGAVGLKNIDVEVEGWATGLAVYDRNGTGTNHYRRVVLKNSGPFGSLDNADKQINIDVFASFNNTSKALNITSDVTIGQCLIVGGGVGGTNAGIVEVTLTGKVLTIHNILMFGIGYGTNKPSAYPLRCVTDATMNLNAGVVHGNIFRPHGAYGYIKYPGASAGIVDTNIDYNGPINFDDAGFNDCYACFYAADSNHMASSLGYYQAAFDSAGKHFSYFPDDHNIWSPTGVPPLLQAFVAGGHDLGFEGPSSSDLSIIPFTAAVASGTGTLTISNGGTVLNYTHSVETGDNIVDLDISKTATESYGGQNISYLGGVTTAYLQGYLHNRPASTLDIVVNPIAVANSSFDDIYSYCLKDATYNLTTTPLDVEWEPTRLFDEEITQAAAIVASFSGVSPTSYMHARYGYASGAVPYLRSAGIAVALGTEDEIGTLSPMANVFNLSFGHDQYPYYLGEADETAWNALSAGEKVDNAERFANALAAVGKYYGAYFPILLAEGAPAYVLEFIPLFITACATRGIKVMSFAEMVQDLETTHGLTGESWAQSYTTNYAPALAASSAGTGVKWWTGPRPVGLDGEPFSDMDTDVGAVQSTHGAFHPVKL